MQHGVGIFVVYFTIATSGKQVRCRRIGDDNNNHIVIYQASNHYECLQFDGVRVFPSSHELITRLIELSMAIHLRLRWRTTMICGSSGRADHPPSSH